MSKSSREKIALLVFVALIVASLIGLIGYLAVGHSWNVAATNIDDATGQMDGYTAVLYSGTVTPKEPSPPGNAGTLPLAPGKPEAPQSLSDPADPADPSEGRLSDAAPGPPGAADAPKPAAKALDTAGEALVIEEVEASYCDKKATAFVIDTKDLPHYREGTILMKGEHRFGVFSVAASALKPSIEKQVAYFKEHSVDFIVVLTPDKQAVEGASAGIDIVISTQDEGLFPMGETINGTFYVSAPVRGAVGAILISPSNVVSAKVIHEL